MAVVLLWWSEKTDILNPKLTSTIVVLGLKGILECHAVETTGTAHKTF